MQSSKALQQTSFVTLPFLFERKKKPCFLTPFQQMKSAMVRMAARLPEHNARLILQIHDEVVVCSYQSSFLVFS